VLSTGKQFLPLIEHLPYYSEDVDPLYATGNKDKANIVEETKTHN
jgi:hypothetical protein